MFRQDGVAQVVADGDDGAPGRDVVLWLWHRSQRGKSGRTRSAGAEQRISARYCCRNNFLTCFSVLLLILF